MAKNTQQTSDSYRILIIEDDPVFRQVCQLTAAQLGNTLVEVADSAERAIELIGCKTYDLLILDVALPGLDGNQFHQMLTRQLAHTLPKGIPPVLVITGRFEDRMDGGLLLGEGVSAVLRKPVEPEVLKQHIRDILTQRTAPRLHQPQPARPPEVAAAASSALDEPTLDRLRNLGGEKLIVQLSESFLGHVPDQVQQIVVNTALGKLAEVEAAAHSIRSSAGILGAMELLKWAGKVEECAMRGNGAELPAAVHALVAALEPVVARLRQLSSGAEA